jgi:hypothetical protein
VSTYPPVDLDEVAFEIDRINATIIRPLDEQFADDPRYQVSRTRASAASSVESSATSI